MATESSLQRTPLLARHQALGARLVEFAGWEMPIQYVGVLEEHRAVRRAVGLFDVSHMGEIRVEGSGAEAFLNSLTPNDVSALSPGQAHYSGLLNEAGGYLDDLLIYRLGDTEFLVVVNADNARRDLEWIEEQLATEVSVRDISAETALLALQGPAAKAVLERLTSLELEGVRYYHFARSHVADREALVSRTGYTGEDGFELYLAPEDAGPVWDRLLEAGEPEGIQPAGLGARDTLRLEAGMALYGHELDENTTPWEAGLGWVVKLEKGDFVGREALLAQRQEGVPRKLFAFAVEERGIARQGHGVHLDARRIGEVTSGTFSPTFEQGIGMAYVETGSTQADAEIELDVRGRMLSGVLRKPPLYRRS